jgi:hypothetical protein
LRAIIDSNLPFGAGGFKTIFTPATSELVTRAVKGGAITVEIAFLRLDALDQFGLEKIVGLNAVCSGNVPDLGDLHGSTPGFCPAIH